MATSKIKTAFFCSNCGHESAKWLGKCPSCNQWNVFVEEVILKDNNAKESWEDNGKTRKGKVVNIKEVNVHDEERIISPDAELNRVL